MSAPRRQAAFVCRTAFLAGCAALMVNAPARADDTDVAQLAATVKALQARLAAVEAENRADQARHGGGTRAGAAPR